VKVPLSESGKSSEEQVIVAAVPTKAGNVITGVA
jgi:hypothetical protein